MKRLMLTSLVVLPAAVALGAGTPTAVTPEGLGPAKFGMTVGELRRALREPLPVPNDPQHRACFYLESKRYPGVSLMMEGGRLRRIDISREEIKTQDRVGVGTPVSEVKRRYGPRLKDKQHHYGGPEDRYLTLSLSSAVDVRFETSNAKVDNFYVGYKAQVQYVEGCL